ncbi:MAG: YiiX/YebB-like N1pC/P60 family cysteine hydrolase [Candidatus Geothermincolia bacterium]
MYRLFKVNACILVLVAALAASPCAVAAGLHDTTWHVVLSWEAQRDLDLHVTGPVTRDRRFALDAWNTRAMGPAVLETSFLPGPGRETATIYGEPSGIYQFYVYDFTGRADGFNDALSASGARVDVYRGPQLERSFVPPAGQFGNLWTVFSMYGDTVTPVGNLTLEHDPRRVGTSPQSALLPGDILLGAESESLVPGAWSHVAIYAGNGEVIEAASEDANITIRTDVEWQDPCMTWVSYLRVIDADAATRARAVAFARKQLARECPYDIRFYSKQATGGSWYCSELVWACYLNATAGRLNLGGTPSWRGVYPWDIARDPRLAFVGGHYEKRATRSWKVAYLYVKLVWNHMSAWIGEGWQWLWK